MSFFIYKHPDVDKEVYGIIYVEESVDLLDMIKELNNTYMSDLKYKISITGPDTQRIDNMIEVLLTPQLIKPDGILFKVDHFSRKIVKLLKELGKDGRNRVVVEIN